MAYPFVAHLTSFTNRSEFIESGHSHHRVYALTTFLLEPTWDVKFGIQIESDWSQMEQIWEFLRSVSVIDCQKIAKT